MTETETRRRLTLDAHKPIGLVALGAAIVDVLAQVDEATLARHDLPKGGMVLVDALRADAIHAEMPRSREVSGGSAANTTAGFAALGGVAAFAGKTREDRLGRVFADDMARIGVRFATPPTGSETELATARSMILVTPDAQRTMATDLGVSGRLAPQDLPEDAIRSARVLYLEGYLWDHEETKQTFRVAMDVAKSAGAAVALTLSDTFCVARHRASFREIVAGPVDLLFANEAEITALYETDDIETAIAAARAEVPLLVVTRSEKGCVACHGSERVDAPAEPIARLVDTTGAGDLFAGGFLYGLIEGRDLATAARMGCVAAAEVIQHVGARPEADLRTLFATKGLLGA